MRKVALAFFLIAGSLFAGEISFSPGFTNAHFRQLASALGDALAFPNLTSARWSGLLGFEIMGVLGGVQVSEEESWRRNSQGFENTLGVLPAPRILLRKGLPGRIGIGLQVGELAGERFLGGEARWTVFRGKVVLPAMAVVASFTRLHQEVLDFRLGELKLVVSKGFVLLTPFVGVGAQRYKAEALFGETALFWHEANGGKPTAFAGVVFHPLPALRIVAEAKKGFSSSYFVGFGVGL